MTESSSLDEILLPAPDDGGFQGPPKPVKPKAPGDVTDEFDMSDVPVPPIATFVSSDSAMKGAEHAGYLGKISEAEARQYVTRSVLITGQTDIELNHLADDPRFGYESKAHVIRHAIEMLIKYFDENKAFLPEHQGIISDITRRQHELRSDAERAKIRNEFRDNIGTFDDEMDSSRNISDYEHIAHRLTEYREMLRGCTFETQRRLLREVLAGSVATRQAVQSFYKWTHEPYRVPTDNWKEEWVELSESWSRFFQEMQQQP